MKKILSLILSITLLFGCTAGISASAATSGITDTDEAIALLTYMDMIESDEDITANITRAEFASLVAKAIKAQPTSGKQYYTDVDAYYWAFDAISALTELGYLSGGDKMAFRPEDNIRLSEAAKIAAYMLGYGELSTAKGGWSAGYLQTASRLGITQGMSSEYITKEQAYVMLMRTMNTPMLVPGSISENGTKYEVDESSTILSVYHDIYYIEDVVKAAGPVSLVSSAVVSEGEVLIGNKVLRTDAISADMYEYLGMTIIGYYTETDGKNASLVVALPVGEENSVITVNKDDVVSIEDKGGYYLFEYYDEDEKREDVKVPRGAVVVKNGMSVTTDLFNELAIDKGSYKFLDHNDDGKIDVLFVNEYYNLIVGLVENKQGMTYLATDVQGTLEYYRGQVGSKRFIYDKFDSTLSVDVTEDSDKIIKFKNADGSVCKIDDIALNEVLSVYKSADGKYIEVVKGSGAVKGVVSEVISTDADTMTLVINDVEYDMDVSVTENASIAPEAGFVGTFYIDAFGKIGYYTQDSDADIRFGYLTKVGRQKSGLDKTVHLEIFSQDNVLDTYTLYTKAVIDGIGIKEDLDKAYDNLLPHAKQMIRFTANENKEVTFVDTLTKNVSQEGDISLTETLAFGSYVNSSVVGSFSKKLVMSYATPVLVVPTDAVIDSGNYDKSSFTVKIKNDLGADSSHYVSSYRLNPDGGFEDIILNKRDGAFYGLTGTKPMMISDIRLALNDDGDTVYKIISYNSESDLPREYETINSSVLKGHNLKKGDLVWFEMNLENKIVSLIDVLVRATDDGPVYNIQNSEGSHMRYYSKTGGRSTPTGITELTNSTATSSFCVMYGFAAQMADGVIRFAHTKEDCANGDYVLARSIINSKVIVYDREGGTDGNIYWASPTEDIIDYKIGGDSCSDVVLFVNQERVQGVFVYK